MVNIKNFDPSLIKIDQKSYKNIDICNIGYITIKRINDYGNVNSVNLLYLIIVEVDGYIEGSSTEENNGNKYLIFASTEKNKKLLEKLWDKIKYHIQTITAVTSGEYENDYMRIKFNSDDENTKASYVNNNCQICF